MTPKQPRFRGRDRLARYIDPEFRKNNKRPKFSAYQRTEYEDYLSVNSLEIETIRQIATTYANKFESGTRPVAIASPKISEYNAAANSVGIDVKYDSKRKCWVFHELTRNSQAYKHRFQRTNSSHCGVEFIRNFGEMQDFRFAIPMARAATYGLV